MPEDIYKGNNDYRYALGVRGKNPLIFFGINPSTATPDNYDQTMNKAKHFALYNKFDSWIMFNVYPQKARYPACLNQDRNDIIHKKNIEIIEEILPNNSTVVAAWGNNITKRVYLFGCLENIVNTLNNKKIRWKHIGSLTTKKHPRHILYLRNDEKINNFDIEKYL